MSDQERNEIVFDLMVNTEVAERDILRLERLLYRSIYLMRRFGLPEEIDAAIYKIQRLIMTIRMAHMAIIAFQAASGPIGWALAGIGAVSAAVSYYDFWADEYYDTTRGRS